MSHVVEDWISFCRSAADEAVRSKGSQRALFAMFQRYRALGPPAQAEVNTHLVEQLLQSDEERRFDAMAMIREFQIVEALPALRRLALNLETESGPSAPYEWAKVNRLIASLSAHH